MIVIPKVNSKASYLNNKNCMNQLIDDEFDAYMFTPQDKR